MAAVKKLNYEPSENVIQRIGYWRVVREVRGYNLQSYSPTHKRWITKTFKADRDEALKLLAMRRVR